MKPKSKKLTLSRETLRHLEVTILNPVVTGCSIGDTCTACSERCPTGCTTD